MKVEFILIPLLMFFSGTSPSLTFTKLLKAPIALLRRINVRIVIFLGDMLVMDQTFKELTRAWESLIFLLQKLSIVINLIKSQLTPVKEMDFMGLLMNSETMTLALPKEKVLYPKQNVTAYSSPRDHDHGINQTFGKACFHSSSCAFKENSVQVLAK